MMAVVLIFAILSILYATSTNAFSIHHQTYTLDSSSSINHRRLKQQPQAHLKLLQQPKRYRVGNRHGDRESHVVVCKATKKTNDEFWAAQRKLMGDMQDVVDEDEANTKQTQKDKYRKQVSSLVSETFYFSILLFSAIWFVTPNPFTAISYLLGALLGTAYTYGLGKYVETLGGSAYEAEDVQGSGVGSARYAFLILLFVLVGKFRSEGLQEIPAIMGFFTYQISSLSQGLKDASVED